MYSQAKRVENMAFYSKSTYSAAYRNPSQYIELLPPVNQAAVRVPTPPPPKKEKEANRSPNYEKDKDEHILPNFESLRGYKSHVDFTLWWKPKEIIRTHPEYGQNFVPNKIDEKKEARRSTRPRVVMRPGNSLDEVEDPNVRDLLIKSTYETTSAKAALDIKPSPATVKAPFSKVPAPGIPVYLPRLRPATVPKEWRLDSIQWDRKQIRGHCEVNKYFWRHMNTQCKTCDQSAEVKKLRQRGRL